MIKKITISFIISFVTQSLTGQCDSAYTYYPNLPLNVTILAGDTCFYDSDVEVLDSIIIKNNLEYDSPLALGTQTWFNGRLRVQVLMIQFLFCLKILGIGQVLLLFILNGIEFQHCLKLFLI